MILGNPLFDNKIDMPVRIAFLACPGRTPGNFGGCSKDTDKFGFHIVSVV